MLARMQTALYRGDAEAAWNLLTDLETNLRRAHLTRVQVLRIEARYLRARCALAMAETSGARRFLSVARRAARRIAAERMPWSDPIALLVMGGVSYLDGGRTPAASYLREAVDGFERADMKLYAAAARCRLGALLGSARGRELRQQAEAWMAAQHIRNCMAMTRMLAPGFPGVA
jgi:ATP/maltotriose-dependent transcriptional regulator MalT